MKKKPVAIKVSSLSKKYFIGENQLYLTLREQIQNLPQNIFNKSKKKSSFYALKNISFEVHKGDVIGMIGRNGAGKSTLLKILSKIVEPTSGKIILSGKVSSLLEIGTGFKAELTGKENIFLSGAILGMKKSEIKNKFNEIVEFSGIGKFIDTPVKRYSSGMYVRLAFSVAAHLDADILLVDEVLAVGDAEFQEKCLGKMKNLSKSGRTVVFVSHNMGAISSFCSKTIYLDLGKIKFYGKTKKTIDKYLSNPKKTNKTSDDSKLKRSGSYNHKITDIFLSNKDGKVIKSPIIGEKLNIHIKYKSKRKKTIKKMKMGITVTNSFGQVITYFNSYNSQNNFSNISPNGEVICAIKKFSIMPGSYQLTLRLSINDNIEDVFDLPEHLIVESGNYFPKNKSNIHPRIQGIFVEQDWSQKKS